MNERDVTEPKRSFMYRLFHNQLPLETETNAFILVSALDVFMTYVLLRSGRFRESNPVADFIFHSWNIAGMVFFKFFFVTFVCIIAQFIARTHMHRAQWLLRFVTGLVACVVIYGLYLFLYHRE